MDINNDLLSKIIGGDSSSKVIILDWDITNNIAKSGNNRTSCLSRLVVEYQRKRKIFKKSFILKVPSAHAMYGIGLRFKVYDKEFPVYADILEEMYKIDGEHIGPRLYYVDNKHSLILKDLSLSGYKIVDRVEQLDYEQCCLVFKSLAKFHALSVKLNQMRKITPELKNNFWYSEKSQIFQEMDEFVKNVSHQFEKILTHEKLHKLYTPAKDNLFEMLRQELHPERYPFCVLNHGDCWTGNTLFKFDKYGIVKKMKLIDFQCCHWATPACDIIFFTITSMKFEVFENHFKSLCVFYVESLNKILHYLQLEPYTLLDLQNDFDNIRGFVVLVLSAYLPQFISSNEDPFDFAKCLKNDRIDYESFNKIYRNEIYLKILHKWVTYYEKVGKILT